MAARIISISNQKGGTAKTTTTLALAAGLAGRGGRVLLVDVDAQGNTTTTAGGEGSPDVFDVLTGAATAAEATHPAKSAVVNDSLFKVDIIPAGRQLVKAEKALDEMGKEYRLKEALQSIRGKYNYILIDTPPQLGILTINALTAADGVIIPACAEPYSIQGIAQLKTTIDAVKKYGNKDLKILGILLTSHRANTRLMTKLGELAGRVAAELGTVVYKTRIRESMAVKEAQAARRPLQDYAAGVGAAADYDAFINELLKQLGVKAK